MPKKTEKSFEPSSEQQALLPEVSGNTLNGVGEKSLRRPTPVYWHKPDTIPHGPAQVWMTEKFNAVPDLRKVYAAPDARGPRKLDAVTDEQTTDLAENWSRIAKQSCLKTKEI